MRILAISNFYPPLIKGGLEISASIICRSLADSGHEVTVLTRESEPRVEQLTPNLTVRRLFQHKFRTEAIHDHHPKTHGWHGVDAAFRNGSVNKPLLRAFLAEHAFDVALCFSLQDIGTSLASELARHGIPVVWSVADYWHIERRSIGSEGVLSKLRRDLFLRNEVQDELGYPMDNVIFISKYMQSEYQKHGISPSRSFVVNRSYPAPEYVEPYDSPMREPVFVVACQLARHKGIHIVVQAAAELKKTHGDREWRVSIYGDGESHYIDEIRDLIAEIHVEDRVRLLGKISHEEISKQMQRSKAFIHAAIWEEPFGRVAIESLANGVPLIAGEASAIHEIVEDDSALLYDRFDPIALADAMRVVLDDPARCDHFSANGIIRHKSHFTPNIENERMIAILEEVASSNSL